MMDAEKHREVFRVPSPVVLELLWVLQSAYAFSRKGILDAFSSIEYLELLMFILPDRSLDCQANEPLIRDASA
jgi:hypothetical protein